MKKYIPNWVTGLNVLSGAIAVLVAMYGAIGWAAGFILLAMVFDFFDGLIARLLHVKSEMGKELDSLADIVSFGMAPAVLAHILLRELVLPGEQLDFSVLSVGQFFFLFLPVLIPFFSAFRLAKFNLDTRQTVSFIGMPVPAHALFWVSLVFARLYMPETYSALFGNVWILAICIVILSLLLVSELPMFSLKLKDFSWQHNRIRYLYLLTIGVLAILFGWAVILAVVPLYVFFCALEALISFRKLS